MSVLAVYNDMRKKQVQAVCAMTWVYFTRRYSRLIGGQNYF